jgi:2-methylcitrate dehydratase
LPYIVARALLDGKIDNSTYSPRKFRDQRLLDFLKKVTVKEDKALSEMYPEAVANRITVTMASGKVISKQVNYHKGHPKNPMSDQEVENKFYQLTRRYLSKNQGERILKALWQLEKARNMSDLLTKMIV